MSATAELLQAQVLEFSLFQGLKDHPAALQELAGLMQSEHFGVRDYILNEKQNDPRLFFLLTGQVVVNKMDDTGKMVVLGRLDAAARPYFGESVLFGEFQKSANVVAHSPCDCLALGAKDFETWMKAHPLLAAGIYRALGRTLFQRLRKANLDVFIAGLG